MGRVSDRDVLTPITVLMTSTKSLSFTIKKLFVLWV